MLDKNYNYIKIINKEYYSEVWLNRIDKRNALNIEMLKELISFFDLNLSENNRFIVIRAYGNSFCSGADLNMFTDEGFKDFATLFSDLLYKIYTCFLPVISVVHGKIFGGGTGLLAVSDIALADKSSQFCFSEVKLGVVPALISPYLYNKLNISELRYLMLSGKIFNTNEAEKIGLVHDIIDIKNETILSAYLKEFKCNGPHAMQKTKYMLNNMEGVNSLEQKRSFVEQLFNEIVPSVEAREGINAFLNHKKPGWTL